MRLLLLFTFIAVATLSSAERVNPTATPVRPSTQAQIDKGELLGHIQYLASDEMRGREAGTPDQLAAARYIADEFQRYGLQPFGDIKDGQRTFFQTFNMKVCRGLGEGSRFVLDGKSGETVFAPHTQFAPFPQNNPSTKANGEVVFAGYGVLAPEIPYDDFAGIELSGKWALLLRYEPQEHLESSKFDGKKITGHSALAAKIGHCIRRKAAGVLIVTGPSGREKEIESITQGRGPSIGDYAIPVMQINRATADAILALSGKTITELQAAIDKDLSTHSFAIPGVKLRGVAALNIEDLPTNNVIARLPSRFDDGTPAAPAPDTQEIVVIGAHCDHVGMGNENSMLGALGKGKLHYGADDNASGTAGLLEVAQHFAAMKPAERPRRPILFMAFSGEEEGLLGSRFYLANPKAPISQTVAMLNMDMIGRSEGGKVQVSGVGTAKGFKDLVRKEAASTTLKVTLGSAGSGPSDHASFFEKKIPVLFFFTGMHGDYHRPTDTWEKINAAAGEAIAGLVSRLLFDLADAATRPEFTNAASGGYMGVSADDQKSAGYAVSKVIDGGPAAQAGLRGGDVILTFNGQKITNAGDLPMMLEDFAPGDVIELSVKRAETTLELKVKLGQRK